MKTLPEVVFLDPNDGIDAFASEGEAPRVAPASVAATTKATAVPARQAGAFRVGRVLALVSYALAGIALALVIVQPTTSPTTSPVAPRAEPTVLPGSPLALVSENLTLAPLIDVRSLDVRGLEVRGLDVVDDLVIEPAPAVVPPAVKPPLVPTPPRVIETPPSPARAAAAPPPAPSVELRERTESLPVATPPPAATTPAPTPVRPPATATGPVPAPAPPTAAPAPAPAPAAPAPATTAPAPATASAPAPAASTIARDLTGVQTALTRYQTAFSALDAREVVRVWPTVNAQNLSRAFDRLESQEISLEGCQVDVHDARAEATCKGTARYVPRVGSRATRVDQRQWRFSLVKSRDEWLIGAVDVR